jgi:prepilin-type N-terminal cleavage/methylation domain-containing protein
MTMHAGQPERVRTCTPARRARGGFTLIEVLMAVLVLGIGLLGLASVLPAVLRQQRVAADTTYGELAGQSAGAYFAARPTLAAYIGTGGGGGPAQVVPVPLDDRFWTLWARPRIDPATGQAWRPAPTPAIPNPGPLAVAITGTQIPNNAQWAPIGLDGTGRGWAQLGIEIRVGSGTGNERAQRPVFVPLADRLYPADSSGLRNPQFVWDLAVRRKVPIRQGANANSNDPNDFPPGYEKVQVAVFVRRIDPRIRIPREQSLFYALLDRGIAPPDRKWPVSEDASGEPSLDGRSGEGFVYSQPKATAAAFRPVEDPFTGQTRRDVIQIIPSTDLAFDHVSRPGQIVVDNLGNVYNVLGPADEAFGVGFGVRVSPAVPAGVVASGQAGLPGQGATQAPSEIRQILYTPQNPVAVKVFEVNP